MFDVKHKRCGKVASKDLKEITKGYELYCPHCDEDLMPSECNVEAPDEDISLLSIMKVNSDAGLSIMQNYDSKEFVGCLDRTLSVVTYNNPVDVAIYHWAIINKLT